MKRSRRQRQLAMIHIGKKDLGLDDETYRDMLHAVARVRSSADLDHHGREAVIKHLRACGARFTPTGRRQYQRGTQAALMAHIWSCLAKAGHIDKSDRALRAWIKKTTATYHPDKCGYDGPELCPPGVARKVIEHLKEWAASRDVVWGRGER